MRLAAACVFSSVAAAFALQAAAAAQEPKPVAAFKQWSVFVKEAGADTVCFAAAEASQKSPQTVTHGDVFFLVATWKSGAARNQPSLMVGYNLKEAPSPTLRIGSQKWDMYVSENEAFIENGDDEQSLVAAMKSGSEMRVAATSARGTATSYVVPLAGVTAALDRAAAACR